MPRVVLTDGPGAGNTTLLLHLAGLGNTTVPETARAIIAERLARGLPPRPSPIEFAQEALRRDQDKYHTNSGDASFVFFDRSALESLAMVHKAQPLQAQELAALVSRFKFHPQVFVLPPWQAIYTVDAERDHSFEHAKRVHESLCQWYAKLGYSLHTVPVGSVEERATFVLRCLAESDA